MEIRHLRYFLQLCKDQNFSAAAGNLFITQQALSKSIKSLESELGAALFSRTNAGVTLTPYAQAILPDCRKVVEDFDGVVERIRGASPNNRCKLKVINSYGAAETLSPTLFEEFMEAEPEVVVSCEHYPDLVAEEQMREGLADLGFSISIPQPPGLFEYDLLSRQPLSLLVSPGNPLYELPVIRMEDLDRQQIYCAGKQFKTYYLLRKMTRRAGVEPVLMPIAAHILSTYQMVYQRQGAVIGLGKSKDYLLFPQMRSIPFADEEMNWDIYLFYRKERELGPQARALRSFLLEYGKGET